MHLMYQEKIKSRMSNVVKKLDELLKNDKVFSYHLKNKNNDIGINLYFQYNMLCINNKQIK